MPTISTVTTRTAMAALATGAGDVAYLTEAGREGAFKFRNTNLSTAVTGDTRQGVYVAPASDTTGASGAWVRMFEERVDVRWFGVAADNSTDDHAAFAAAIAFCLTLRNPAIDGSGNQSANYGSVPILSIPIGTYYLSDTLEIKGATMVIDAVPNTILRFPADTSGIRVQSIDTTGETTGAQTTAADNTILRGLTLRGGGGTNREKHGIWMRASAQVYNCNVANFPGDGIHVVADVTGSGAVRGNANGWTVEDAILARNGRHGFYAQGGDVNAGTAKRINALSNSRFGVYDRSFLANTHIGHHCDSNGLVGAGPTSYANTVPSVVHYGGNTYAVVIGQETAASTTTPGTNGAVWARIGPGGATAEVPTWSSGTTYAAGGSYATDSLNARNAFIGCYEEGTQAPHQIMRPSIILGGLMTGLAGVASGLHLVNLNNALLIPALKSEALSANGHTLTTDIGGEQANDVMTTMTHSSYAPLGYKAKFITPNYFFPLAYNGQSGTAPYYVTTAATNETYGSGVAQPHVFGAGRIAIGSRLQTNGTAAPTTGAHAQGEIVWNEAPAAGGKVGWVCTSGGSPGTWKAFGAIDS